MGDVGTGGDIMTFLEACSSFSAIRGEECFDSGKLSNIEDFSGVAIQQTEIHIHRLSVADTFSLVLLAGLHLVVRCPEDDLRC